MIIMILNDKNKIFSNDIIVLFFLYYVFYIIFYIIGYFSTLLRSFLDPLLKKILIIDWFYYIDLSRNVV